MYGFAVTLRGNMASKLRWSLPIILGRSLTEKLISVQELQARPRSICLGLTLMRSVL